MILATVDLIEEGRAGIIGGVLSSPDLFRNMLRKKRKLMFLEIKLSCNFRIFQAGGAR